MQQLVNTLESRPFRLIKLDGDDFLVIILSVLTPELYWEELNEQISTYKVTNKYVYFDYLFINGNKKRFFRTTTGADYRCNIEFEFCEKQPSCSDIADSFFRDHQEYIKMSAMPSIQRRFFLKKFVKIQ